MIFGFAGASGASLFTDVQTLNIILAEGPIADLFIPNSYTYQHLTPADFEVPYDTVNSASLSIKGYLIDGDDDTVSVQGNLAGTLTDSGWLWSSSTSVFDIATAFSVWATGSPLAVTITGNGSLLDGVLKLKTSTFSLDYTNGNAPPVPEPGTMLLVGTGLLGLVAVNRKWFRKKG